MKKFIIWLAKVFDVNITKEVVVEKEIIRYVASGDVIEGDVKIKGNLVVNGSLRVEGNICCFNKK